MAAPGGYPSPSSMFSSAPSLVTSRGVPPQQQGQRSFVPASPAHAYTMVSLLLLDLFSSQGDWGQDTSNAIGRSRYEMPAYTGAFYHSKQVSHTNSVAERCRSKSDSDLMYNEFFANHPGFVVQDQGLNVSEDSMQQNQPTFREYAHWSPRFAPQVSPPQDRQRELLGCLAANVFLASPDLPDVGDHLVPQPTTRNVETPVLTSDQLFKAAKWESSSPPPPAYPQSAQQTVWQSARKNGTERPQPHITSVNTSRSGIIVRVYLLTTKQTTQNCMSIYLCKSTMISNLLLQQALEIQYLQFHNLWRKFMNCPTLTARETKKKRSKKKNDTMTTVMKLGNSFFSSHILHFPSDNDNEGIEELKNRKVFLDEDGTYCFPAPFYLQQENLVRKKTKLNSCEKSGGFATQMCRDWLLLQCLLANQRNLIPIIPNRIHNSNLIWLNHHLRMFPIIHSSSSFFLNNSINLQNNNSKHTTNSTLLIRRKFSHLMANTSMELQDKFLLLARNSVRFINCLPNKRSTTNLLPCIISAAHCAVSFSS